MKPKVLTVKELGVVMNTVFNKLDREQNSLSSGFLGGALSSFYSRYVGESIIIRTTDTNFISVKNRKHIIT